jgi:serine/threonine protein kinase
MGTVWEVEDTPLGRRCALKLLHGDFVRSPQAVRRFLREGKLLARINHQGVVEVFDVGMSPDQVPYLVMALVEGENLEQRLARAGPFGVEDAVGVLVEVLEALDAIHKAGVVHRDLKPSNLILSAGGVRVVDFGIATVADGTKLTQAMDRMGTVHYMAPEQWSGEFSPRSDIYACGRILFALLAGRPPKGPAEKLTSAGEAVPQAVERVYERATAIDPNERYGSTEAMAQALRSALELTRRPESPGSPPGPFEAPDYPHGALLQETCRRLRDLGGKLVDLADDLRVLEQLIVMDVPSSLNRMRYITEKVLFQLCQKHGVAWGQAEPTLERMLGPLVAAGHVPKNVAIHVRTVQGYTAVGSHYQASSLSVAHAVIALAALTEILRWSAGAA